jgi:transcriptional regulator with XRE-family HTH domain
VQLRKAQGVSQVELARRLGRTQQFVSLVERSERRIDIIEFYAVVKALGGDPEATVIHLFKALPEDIRI